MAQPSQKSDISRHGHVLLGIERAFIDAFLHTQPLIIG